MTDTLDLYDEFAPTYDRSFAEGALRRLYDRLTWTRIIELLPAGPGLVADVGCGTGRGIERLLAEGHRVIGIEPSTGMQNVLRDRFAGRQAVELVALTMEEAAIGAASIDAVLAIGSLQYARAPRDVLAKFARWVRPGGLVVVQVDSRVALTLELLRAGRSAEAIARLRTGRGSFSFGTIQAPLELFNANSLREAFLAAGLDEVNVAGLLITASALGREGCRAAIEADPERAFELERELQQSAELADCGKHLLAWGRRPR